MKKYTGLEIAIIGVAGRFPGANNVSSFWNNLKEGVESISFFSDAELLEAGESPEMINHPSYVKANGLLQEKEYFDSAFFNYLPDEARLMDPQTRLLHECVWEAIEDAGCDLKDPKNKIGLFAGASSNINWELYTRLINREGLVDEFSASQLSNPRFIATRISYALSLRGPAIFIDSACSTSLVAVHIACENLLLANCNIAIAGGVSLTNKSKQGYLYADGMIYSKDGHCRAFDAASSGTVGGEGAGVVVLKTLKNALQDGDHIWAIIKGSGINNDGNNKVGYTAPSIDGQTEVIMRAQKWAKVEPESIGFIEAHGTATRLGDPIEVEALNRAFGKSSEKYCALGSVKTNIGHLDAAAGVTGLIKAVLSLKNKQIPPSLNFRTPNPEINFADTPFYVNTELKEWHNAKFPLRAGVSAFGIGGTNVHVILEEAPEPENFEKKEKHQLLLLSAKTPACLERNIANLCAYLKANPAMDLSDVAYTTQQGREHFPFRKAIACNSIENAIELLSKSTHDINMQPVTLKSKPVVVFMFTGAGSQYANMYHDLYQKEPFFKAEVDKCFNIVKQICGKDLKTIIFPADHLEGTSHINSIENTQPSLFIMEYALAKLMMKWGITPDIMIGHSFGEYVAACISGVFLLEDALFLIVKRGEVMLKVPKGLMLSISIAEKDLQPFLEVNANVSLAAVNSSELCVVSGAEDAVVLFKSLLESEGYNCKILLVGVAGHSSLMDVILDEFEGDVKRVKLGSPQIPFISNLSGKEAISDEVINPKYWIHHLRQTVKFSQGIESILVNKNAVFIEMGPANVLGTFVRSDKLREKAHRVVNLVRHPNDTDDDFLFLLNGLREIWTRGVEPDWKNFAEGETHRKVSLPAYSFDKIKYPVCVDARKLLGLLPSSAVETHSQKEYLEKEFESYGSESTNHLAEVTSKDIVNPTERKLLHLWQVFFGKSTIEPEDSFFEIGGDSLKALTMIGRIQKTFNTGVSIKEFFNHPTVKDLAAFLDSKNNKDGEVYAAIPKATAKSHYKLSSSQKRLYFLHEFDKTSVGYNISRLVKIEGILNRQRLHAAINALVNRHESLRTYFEILDQQPVQAIASDVTFELEYFHTDAGDSTIIRDFVRPFDLHRPPLLRAALIETGSLDHILILDMHHIVVDGLSIGVLIEDLMALYNGEQLPDLMLHYKDYAEWQQSEAQQQQICNHKIFWLNEFAEELTVLELPTDYVRPSVKSYDGDRLSFEINELETHQLKLIAESQKATLFMVLLSAYNVLLSKFGNQEDIVIGTPGAGRHHSDVESIIGMFVNTLPLRNYPKGSLSFSAFLQDVKARTLMCFDHQIYPYEELVDELKVTRETNRNPLFDVMFIFHNFSEPDLEVSGLSFKPFVTEHTVAQFDITLSATEEHSKILLNFDYATQLFKKDTVNKFVNCFKKIISTVIADINTPISDIELIPQDEKLKVLKHFNKTNAAYPKQDTIVSLFEKQVHQTPEKIAVVYEGKRLTYRELHEQSNQLAHLLRDTYEVKPGDLVGIMVERSEKMMVGLLGILKSGGAYVPIDPTYPKDRIEYILADSKANVLLVSKPEPGDLRYNGIVLNLCEEYASNRSDVSSVNASEDLCYLIYTSGSTGKPKGVMVSHRNVVNFFAGISHKIQTDDDDCMLSVTSVSFDISVLELFWTLCNGIEVVIHPSDISLSSLDRYVSNENRSIDFGLFFFSSYNNSQDNKYNLLLEAAKFADKAGFNAVWTPERHFHEFGGLYPSPSVTSSALAMVTKNIELRSGSIVSPLHDPVRIAEEWSVVDNLSNGRVAISFASGWNPNDFVLSQASFKDRQHTMYSQIEVVKKLWRGESIARTNGLGKEVNLRVFPIPIQKELPVWITSSGNEETFKMAGAIGANLITHFLGQDVTELARKIKLYRESRILHGHIHKPGKVALMLHTYVGDDIKEVETLVEKPFIEYLKSSIGLVQLLNEEGIKDVDISEEDKSKILKGAFSRYYKTGSLIGTKATCSETIQTLIGIGVDEIACLVDFGVEESKVLEGLRNLKELKELFSASGALVHKPVTMMQSTPSFLQPAEESLRSKKFLQSLRHLFIGGEAVPQALVKKLTRAYGASVYNMYGPTETTIWSCMHQFNKQADQVVVGKPMLNTQVYILDKYLKIVPIGVTGDLFIGGDGLSRGYWEKTALTNEKFIVNPFDPADKMYATGDVARWLPDGTIQLIGRKDHQVKVRGYRIELGEIENALLSYNMIKEAVVVVKEQKSLVDKYLAAYVICHGALNIAALREHLMSQLPNYMMPGHIVQMDKFPLTPNGKIDRKKFPDPEVGTGHGYVAPSNDVEEKLTEIWSDILQLDKSKISVDRSFFELGGHSLKATILANKIQQHFEIEIPLKEIFNKQSIETLADYLITVKQIGMEISDNSEIVEINI